MGAAVGGEPCPGPGGSHGEEAPVLPPHGITPAAVGHRVVPGGLWPRGRGGHRQGRAGGWGRMSAASACLATPLLRHMALGCDVTPRDPTDRA